MGDLKVKIRIRPPTKAVDAPPANAASDKPPGDEPEGQHENGNETPTKKRSPQLRPVYLTAPQATDAVNYQAWKKVCEYKEPEENPVMTGVIPMDDLNKLWRETVSQHQAQVARVQKRKDIELKMKEDREKEIQALREAAQEEEAKRQREEDAARARDEARRKELREKARLERETLSQTIDMDAQQQIMDDDDDDDDDLGGF
uniref:Uncharacterized protein n=1 Tax=Mucochytrium quahogii TaxID=96639 RepID=A0A7S2SR20_9STRA|mmetsp:Transcript_4032/g.5903  ORF Transcript_4032/g.5903 Transcript_4032/m.5903 type:complete len:202 (+) Transcript_4032:2055-2660(+)